MAEHASITVACDMEVFFCDPHSPWQRGSNENTNGLLRQYWPKGTDFGQVSPREVRRVQDELNGRPRQVLDYETPDERMPVLLGVAPTT